MAIVRFFSPNFIHPRIMFISYYRYFKAQKLKKIQQKSFKCFPLFVHPNIFISSSFPYKLLEKDYTILSHVSKIRLKMFWRLKSLLRFWFHIITEWCGLLNYVHENWKRGLNEGYSRRYGFPLQMKCVVFDRTSAAP